MEGFNFLKTSRFFFFFSSFRFSFGFFFSLVLRGQINVFMGHGERFWKRYAAPACDVIQARLRDKNVYDRKEKLNFTQPLLHLLVDWPSFPNQCFFTRLSPQVHGEDTQNGK